MTFYRRFGGGRWHVSDCRCDRRAPFTAIVVCRPNKKWALSKKLTKCPVDGLSNEQPFSLHCWD